MKGMYEVVVVPIVPYGREAWLTNARDVSRMEAIKMREFKSGLGYSLQVKLGKRIEQTNLRWYSNVMRIC